LSRAVSVDYTEISADCFCFAFHINALSQSPEGLAWLGFRF